MLSFCTISSKIVSNAELPSMKATPTCFIGITRIPVNPCFSILLADNVVNTDTLIFLRATPPRMHDYNVRQVQTSLYTVLDLCNEFCNRQEGSKNHK